MRKPWKLRYLVSMVLASGWIVFAWFIDNRVHHNGWSAIGMAGSFLVGVVTAALLAPVWNMRLGGGQYEKFLGRDDG